MHSKKKKRPALWVALLPVIVLVALVLVNVLFLDENPLDGSSQVSLLLSTLFIAALAKLLYNVKWNKISDGIVSTVSSSLASMYVLFTIGMLAGTWMIGGVIPAFIYYGLFVLRPEFFLPAALIISCLVSLCTGSSWTTIATIGVAILGMGNAMGVNPAMTAGALISGAYFGDKVSPLSDTTNLASACINVDLLTHIKFMMRSSLPAIIITFLIFSAISLLGNNSVTDVSQIKHIQAVLKDNINMTPLVFLVPVAVAYMIHKKLPVLVTLVVASLLGIVSALIFQPELISQIKGVDKTTLQVLARSIYGTSVIEVGEASLDSLLTTKGMAGMLNTIWLILMAMAFGGAMEASGFLQRITEAIISKVNTTGSLVTATVLNCLLFNLILADQYLTIVLSGKMFSEAYEDEDLAPEMLSRTIEDAGTVTSVLIPWNSCGATQSAMLGVATISYLPFAFFCYLSPIISILLAVTGWGVRKKYHRVKK